MQFTKILLVACIVSISIYATEQADSWSEKYFNSFLKFMEIKLNLLFDKKFDLGYKDDYVSNVKLLGFPLVKFSCKLKFSNHDDYGVISGCAMVSGIRVSMDIKAHSYLPVQNVVMEVKPLETQFKLGVFPKENPDRPKYEFKFKKTTPEPAGIQFLSLAALTFRQWNGVNMEGSYLSQLAGVAMKFGGISETVKAIVEQQLGPTVASVMYDYARLPETIMGNELDDEDD